MFRANTLLSKRYEDHLITLLRFTIALIFAWFGSLKVLGYNPVFELTSNSLLPFVSSGYGLVGLGLIEVLIGFFLFTNRALVFTHIALFFHLLGTFTTFFYGWQVVFKPYFPILSLDGEFVIKNLILTISGLVVLVHESRRRRS